MTLTTKQQAVYGCLLGGAYGDALGLPYEGLSGRRGKRLFGNSLAFNLLPFGKLGHYGMVSDDTEHAVMAVQAWIASQHLLSTPHTQQQFGKQCEQQFAKSLAWRLRLWLLGLPAGIGLATGRALFRLWLFLPTSGVFSAGNGGAMRASVLGVLSDEWCDDWSDKSSDDMHTLKMVVRLSTTLTHTDPKAYQGALVIALCAWHSYHYPQADNKDLVDFVLNHLDDNELKDYLTQAYQAQLTDTRLNQFMQSTFAQKSVSGYMYHTVPAVWFAYLRHRHQPMQGLQCLIEAGGDVDTTCAIAGGIWGVQYGQQIQASVQGKLLEPKLNPRFFYRLSQQVYQPAIYQNNDKISGKNNSTSKQLQKQETAVYSKTTPLRFGGIITLLRNLIFLLIVLVHGFRRLLPPY